MTSHRVAYPSLLLLLHAVISTISPLVPLSQATESDVTANTTGYTVSAMGPDIDKTTFFKVEEISTSLLEEDAESDVSSDKFLTINISTNNDSSKSNKNNNNRELQFSLTKKYRKNSDSVDNNSNSTISLTTNSLFSRTQSVCSKCFKFHEFHTNRRSSPREFRSSLMRRTLTNKSDLSVSAGVRVGENATGGDKVVTILGLFELSTHNSERPEGKSELQAAMMAVKHVNEANVLEGYRLHLLTNDTKCDPGVGVDTYFHALYTHTFTKMPMLLGTGCSDVTESLAKITPYWNMVQVSFGSTSPVLSDRREFPLFYRTAAPDSSHNPARLAFIKRFGWETITALSQNEDLYSLAVNDLVTQLESANITCQGTITFAEDDFEDQLKTVKEMDTRIIIGSFSHEVAPKVFCQAHKLGMFGSDYVWILHGSPRERWWLNQTQCTQAHLSAAVEGLILVSSHNSIVGNKSSLSGLTNAKFVSSLPQPISPYVHQTYDAVWAIALAMRHADVNVSGYDYTRTDMAERFSSQLEQLRFLGVSGPVAFNGADRVGISAFYQVQEGAVVRVALFDPFTEVLDFACLGCHSIVWQGAQVPIAKRVFKLRVVTIQPAAFLTIACLASVGITLAIAFLAFNLYFRRLKYIKLSSPRLNNMAVVGCILVYMAVILLGLDHATLPSKAAFPTVCTARVYLLSAGFSLAFGSMFTKTYRVHRIFTRSSSGVVKNKLLQDTQLISLICVLLLIDGLIVTLWVAVDPMQRQLRNLSLEISSTDRSVVYQPQVEVCGSQFTHTWLGALYVYKGLLLIVGVYMAWETRHVKIPALNDSQYIGMSVYSVVITSAIVVVLANLISERATLAFFTITILILFSTTTSLCLLFLPKLHAIFSHPDNTTDPIMHSMGLKIEFNTRRLLMDDRREVYYRVEVQNRVYHRELSALDNEIARLERQLCSDPPTASSSHSSVASRKGELTPLDEAIERLQKVPQSRGKSPSVSGGLPMLLLSVLPPVIPRASWPSAEHCMMPSHGVQFNSEPKLDDTTGNKDKHRGSQSHHHHYYRDSIQYNESTGKVSMFGKLLTILGNKNSASNRKTSAASYTGTSGIAAALKAHVGYFAGLVPSTKSGSGSLDSSCNTSRSAINKDKKISDYYSGENDSSRYGGRFMYRSSRDVGELPSDDDARSQARSVQSLSHRVSFSIQHQHSQPILAFREKVKGSPRFPHRIVPTCSLNALEERKQSISYGNSMDPAFIRRNSQLQAFLQKPLITSDNNGDNNAVEKCESTDENIVVVVQNVDNNFESEQEECKNDVESENVTEVEERNETLVM